MTEHLTSHEVTDWRSGVTGAEEILRLDDHLAECAACRALVAGDLKNAVEALRAEFSRPHLTESELDDYAGHKPLSADSMQHLDLCQTCRGDADDLRKFADANRPQAEPASGRKSSEPVSIRRNERVWLRPLAAVLAVTALGLSAWRIFQKPAPVPVAAPVEIATNIPAQYQTEVNAAIDSGALHIPPAISGLTSGPIQLRSLDKPSATSALRVISPVATGVVEETPLFRWTQVDGATYSVAVYDDQFRAVASVASLQATEWLPAKPLARGATYRWEVRAMKGGHTDRAPGPTEPEARFTVLSADDAERLSNARSAMPAAPLALGILYADAGALDDAKRELSAAATTGTPTQKSAAERLLGQLK